MQVGWNNKPKLVTLCCENVVNANVSVRFRFPVELIFFALGWICGVLLGGFGDLLLSCCDLLEVEIRLKFRSAFGHPKVKNKACC